MARYTHYYLINIEYLGFRFHGWQKQTNAKTIHEMIDKTMVFVLGHENYKTMGTSRTDAKVSALQSAFELFLFEPISDKEEFLKVLNSNFPFDIKATEVVEVDNTFNVINSSKEKEYHYYFASGQKAHPYSSPFVFSHLESLDVDLMKKGAELFLGKHNFKGYCTQPKPGVNLVRTITKSEIVENDGLKANFFPDNMFIYKVRSAGFMRNQVRLMMGQLIQLGLGKIDLEKVKHTIETGEREHSLFATAPASGLHLAKIDWA
ncbi:MAG: tRNA pseudouridine synthase A [Salibacteraceae bacterium]